MAVTELEVFRVTETLMEDIVAFKPPREMGMSEVRVLMLGPVGSGKSSFYNTVNSIFNGCISQRTRSGKAAHSITTLGFHKSFC
ncbi:interferon-induced protein 44-like [Dreissena polymorpha]|uniref:interferon-induced protein 44-like n=1 Tax=Dreissena polymorpha TaxID=45954 RepID=UPI002263B159|nr:interferon-induced protein 44-like [Dreissena polymorpha]